MDSSFKHFRDAVDLQHENDELGLQNRKLVCEMNDLRQQIIQAEEANSVLLVIFCDLYQSHLHLKSRLYHVIVVNSRFKRTN